MSAPVVDGSVVEAGIYQMTAAEYHRDPCPEPSLSSSIAKLLCLSSPAHARHAHPRLNPQHAEEEAGHYDIGRAAHALLLEWRHGDTSGVVIVDAPDWRTKAAREARDAARAEGKTPLLAHVWADVQAMVKAAHTQLGAHIDGGCDMFLGGKAEQTLIWQEGDIWCRARLDYVRTDAHGRQACDDLKTTSGSANPESWTRALFGLGYDLQAAHYLRGLKVLTGFDATFRFAVIETTQPYALSVIALGPDAMTIAEKKRLFALEQWGACMRANTWPGYPTRTCWAELPPWEESRWLAKEDQSFDDARKDHL